MCVFILRNLVFPVRWLVGIDLRLSYLASTIFLALGVTLTSTAYRETLPSSMRLPLGARSCILSQNRMFASFDRSHCNSRLQGSVLQHLDSSVCSAQGALCARYAW